MTRERRAPRRVAVPAIAVAAAGLTWALRTQGVIGPTAAAGGPPATASGPDVVPGETVTTRFGPVQVAATVHGGRLVEVVALQAPAGDPNSKRINDQALPVLRQEALAAQSARLDTVTGATFTTEGYRQSLQSALDAAGFEPDRPTAPTEEAP